MVTLETYHATGTDYIVVDTDEDVVSRRSFAREFCDPDDGLAHPDEDRTGAEGVLFLSLEPECSPPRVIMTVVKPDGNVAEMSGNGARIAAAWANDRLGADVLMIDTMAGTRRATVEDDYVTVEMGDPVFGPGAVPVDGSEPFVEQHVGEFSLTAVNTGIPHAVAFVDDVDDVDLDAAGPDICHAPAFPEGVNLTVAARRDQPTVDVDGSAGAVVAAFDQRTYEADGREAVCSCTGATAVAAAARKLGIIGQNDRVAVHPPGGRLDVRIPDGNARLGGPVSRKFAGRVADGSPGD